MGETARFKIDLYDNSSRWIFGLYHRKCAWWTTKWEFIDRFETKEEAKALYEKVKDLPEYLP